ncbi:MAG TPA: 50S ribosomal protein L32e [Candidatus Lokiarchaeia archaeon]
MTEKERLLELRKKINGKRPSFRRVESWRMIRVKDSWRKSRGIDSKTRRKTKAGVKSPSIGYRGPKKVRGLHPSGFEEVRIDNKEELIKLNLSPKKHAIKISGRLGARKRLDIIDWLQKRNFKILNLGISQKEMEELEAMLEESEKDLVDEKEELGEEEKLVDEKEELDEDIDENDGEE